MLRHKTIRARFVVHPHIRGGTPPVVTVRVYLPRFIPTHVGNTSENSIRVIVVPVHPHTRGEHLCEHVRHPGRGGSSPHTWGTRAIGGAIPKVTRFIPTHVGNTPVHDPLACPGQVHPHTRGEHPRSQHRSVNMDGSSPHTWGTLRGDGAGQDGDRFIPTHVGNTMISSRSSPAGPVHPHTRGEHGLFAGHPGHCVGSSPHTWGTRRPAADRPDARRFIPTHVGNTSAADVLQRTGTVHPHTRGEHGLPCEPGALSGGSSPHTWGTRISRFCALPGFRFIPTHVGNTRTATRRRASSPVHPHTRGEHASGLQVARIRGGSSPHTWGTPRLHCFARRVARFIPTHVGNTCR